MLYNQRSGVKVVEQVCAVQSEVWCQGSRAVVCCTIIGCSAAVNLSGNNAGCHLFGDSEGGTGVFRLPVGLPQLITCSDFVNTTKGFYPFLSVSLNLCNFEPLYIQFGRDPPCTLLQGVPWARYNDFFVW